MRPKLVALLVAVAAGLSLAACSTNGQAALATRTSASLDRACRADTKVVAIASKVLQHSDPQAYQHFTSEQWKADILGAALPGGPFLQRWPTIDSAYYLVSIAPATPLLTTGDHVRTMNGDVILIVVSSRLSYDATVHPDAACAAT